MNFEKYYKPASMTAIYYRVPISLLEIFRTTMAAEGKFYKIRYRGPRPPSGRSFATRQSTCLKSDATCFSAYIY
jgi:hypothetical protein